MRRLTITTIFAFSLCVMSCTSISDKIQRPQTALPELGGAEAVYFEALVQTAITKKLHEKRFWRLLLHYFPEGNGWESEQDANSFFLAPDGKTNPENELKYTLRAFFDHPFPVDEHPQCIFVARYHWLNQELDFNPDYIPEQSCPKYEKWYESHTPTGLSLIFPSYDLSSPGSMFGHTLLVLRSEEFKTTPLLDDAINFGALSPPSDSPITFMFRGLFGLYPGIFGRQPYYYKIQEYVNQELRDLWEYHLNISEEGLRNVQRHAWELDNAFFDYYFLKENCAYFILALIEVGEPFLHLREDYLVKALPSDTVRQMLSYEGFVVDKTYYPSRANKVKQKLEKLSQKANTAFFGTIESKPLTLSPLFQELETPEKALLLEAITEYLVIIKSPESKALRMRLLKERSELEEPTQHIEYTIQTSPPESGHKTTRLGVSLGSHGKNSFFDIEARGVFQDILDNDQAYLPFKQIEIGKGKIRFYPETSQLLVENITIANVISLDYWSPFKPNLGTWKGEIAFRPERVSNHCTEMASCMTLQLNIGYGVAKKIENSVIYGMIDSDIHIGGGYDHNYQMSIGADIGAVIRYGYDWKGFLSIKYSNFVLGELDMYPSVRLGIRRKITTDTDLRLEYTGIKEYVEAKLTVNVHI